MKFIEDNPISQVTIGSICLILFIITLIGSLTSCSPLPRIDSVEPLSFMNSNGTAFCVAERPDRWIFATAGHVVESFGGEDLLLQIRFVPVELEVLSDQYDLALVSVPKHVGDFTPYVLSSPTYGSRGWIIGFVKASVLVMFEGQTIAPEFGTGTFIFQGGALPGVSGGPILDDRNRAVGMVVGVIEVWDFPAQSVVLALSGHEIQHLLDTIE